MGIRAADIGRTSSRPVDVEDQTLRARNQRIRTGQFASKAGYQTHLLRADVDCAHAQGAGLVDQIRNQARPFGFGIERNDRTRFGLEANRTDRGHQTGTRRVDRRQRIDQRCRYRVGAGLALGHEVQTQRRGFGRIELQRTDECRAIRIDQTDDVIGVCQTQPRQHKSLRRTCGNGSGDNRRRIVGREIRQADNRVIADKEGITAGREHGIRTGDGH